MKIEIKGPIVSNDDRWVYDLFGIEAVSPKDVSDVLNQANGKPVAVEINSGGGDIFAGSEIYTALKTYKGKINIRVVGLAGSAASVILCAGESEITPPGMVMIHNVALYGVSGDYHEMSGASEALISANKSIAAAYERKTGKHQKEILAAMDKETWMSSSEAVEFGIVDRVMTDSPKMVAAFGSQMIPPNVMAKVKSVLKNSKKDFEIEKEELAKEQKKLDLIKKEAVRNEYY